ncbi:hypothetical protein JZ751_022074 [Albula glossodonta]|uniref:Poly [ADP-ribose] polymerase n=1 Tax=Albula glossodonta TaxID=121402 RepID=A0A8T2MRR3_9TELE|nr:hypothetical protein JZ751_022074 [Albula glossodonta]
MEESGYRVFASCEGSLGTENTPEQVLRYFSLRSKSGGGECAVSQVGPHLYCVTFRSEEGTGLATEDEGSTNEIQLKHVPPYQLLIQPYFQKEVEQEHPDVTITLNTNARSIKLTGPSSSVQAAKGKLQDSLRRVRTKELPFPQAVIGFLISKGLQEVSRSYFLQVGVYAILAVSVSDSKVVLHGLSQFDLQRAEKILGEKVSTTAVPLGEHLEPVAYSEDFADFIVQLNSSQKAVQISWELDGKNNNRIMLVGNREEFNATERKMVEFLWEKREDVELVKVEGPPEVPENLPHLMDFLGLGNLTAQIRWLPDARMLEIRGKPTAVEEAARSLRQKMKGVVCKTVEICRPEAHTYFSGNGQGYLNSMQSTFNCRPVLRPKPNQAIQAQDLTHKVDQLGADICLGTKDKEVLLIAQNVTVHIEQVDKVTELADVVVNPLCRSTTESKMLDSAGADVKEELAKTARWYSITVTGPGALPCRLLVHIPCLCGSSMKDYLLSTIQECKRRGFKLITVYIDRNELHSGFDAKQMAKDLMLTALKHLDAEDELRIVIPQEDLFNIFRDKAKTIHSTHLKLSELEFFVSASPRGVLACLGFKHRPKDDVESLHHHSHLCEPAVIDLFSRDRHLLGKAGSALERHYATFLSNDTLVNPSIRSAGRAAMDKICQLEGKHRVNVTVGDGVVIFNGLAAKTSEAWEEALSILDEDREQRQRDKHQRFCRNARWTVYNQQNLPVNIDPKDNYNMEIQHMTLRKPTTVQGQRGETLTVNFRTMTAKSSTTGLQHKVERTEVVGSGNPGKWSEMGSEDYRKEELDRESLEYRWVERMFNRTMSKCSITKTNGFFRPEESYFYSDTAQGRGIYFCVDASAAQRKCEFDHRKQKMMFLGRVETGRFTVGKKSFNAPPPINPANPRELYSSVVDNVDKPSVFVVFRSDKTYPEYCITFTE